MEHDEIKEILRDIGTLLEGEIIFLPESEDIPAINEGYRDIGKLIYYLADML